MGKQYAERDIMALDQDGGHYTRHLSAMTGEALHDKSDIAAELAWRDAEIARLEQERDAYRTAEEHQIALRQKIEQERDSLAAQAHAFRKKSQELHTRYPLSPWIQQHYESVMNTKPEKVLARRDALNKADAFAEAATICQKVKDGQDSLAWMHKEVSPEGDEYIGDHGIPYSNKALGAQHCVDDLLREEKKLRRQAEGGA